MSAMSANQQLCEPLIVHDVPQRHWQKVGCDLFTIEETDYMCTVDYYSGDFEIDRQKKKRASAVIKRLKLQFSNHGIPKFL